MRLSRPSRILRAAGLVVVVALIAPALTAAAPARPDPAAAARAVGRYYASFGADPDTRPDAGAAARAVGRYYASFGAEQPLPPPRSVAAVARPLPGPDGPSWAAALVAGALAALATAGLGVIAGRHSTRVRHG